MPKIFSLISELEISNIENQPCSISTELSSSTGAEVPGLKLKQWWMKGGGGSQESSSNPEAGLERKVPSFKSPSSSERYRRLNSLADESLKLIEF